MTDGEQLRSQHDHEVSAILRRHGASEPEIVRTLTRQRKELDRRAQVARAGAPAMKMSTTPMGQLAKALAVAQEPRIRRIEALDKAVRAHQALGDDQAARALGAEADRQRLALGRAAERVGALTAAASQAQQISEAAAPAVEGLQSGLATRNDAREQLRAIGDGTDQVQSLPRALTELPSQTRIAMLETQLAKAVSASERERLGYVLTREKLIAGHRDGSLAPRRVI